MDLLVQKRDLSVAPKVLLRGGFIPAELYGRGVSNIHLSVPAKEFRRVFATAGETTIVNLLVDGSTHPVLITDVTNDSLTGEPTHIDFYQIQAGQKITAPVPLEYVGEAPAVALGGVLTKAFSEIEVEAVAEKLPHSFVVDISVLKEIGDTIAVSDLNFPDGVKVLIDTHTVLASVSAAREEEIVTASDIDLSAIKTEGDIKKAEREAQKSSEDSE
jgi:large subunit ribosomal protein L25